MEKAGGILEFERTKDSTVWQKIERAATRAAQRLKN
jgi:hypothetical protein